MRSLADLRAPSDIRSGQTRIPLKGSGSTQTNFSFANSRRVDDPRRTSRLHFWPLTDIEAASRNVCFWPSADISTVPTDVRLWG